MLANNTKIICGSQDINYKDLIFRVEYDGKIDFVENEIELAINNFALISPYTKYLIDASDLLDFTDIEDYLLDKLYQKSIGELCNG